MQTADATEANEIVQRLLANLSVCIPQAGLPGSSARTAIGDLVANAYVLLRQDAIGPPLQECFYLVQQAGCTLAQMAWILSQLELETPQTLGGTLITNSCIQLALSFSCDIITGMTFVSRQDVEALLLQIQPPFNAAEEIAADDMDQAVYMGLISLRAALVNYLVTTARPLPRMVNYQFANVLPTLVIAYRLYADASRADEIRAENKIVHPAFCPTFGRALSS